MVISIPCQFDGCSHVVNHDLEAVALAMFNSHLMSHNQPKSSSSNSQRLPPIPRPEVKQDISEEDWVTFEAEWKNFKRCTSLSEESVADQLFQSCDKNLMRLLIRAQPDIVSEGEARLLEAIKNLVVIKIATSARRTNLLASKQAHGVTFREFYANIRAAAAICKFSVKCPHTCCAENPLVDYTSNVVKDVLIAGILDADIRKEVLAWTELDSKDDKDVVGYVEAKEMAYKAWSDTQTHALTVAGVSNYRKNAKSENEPDQSMKTKLAMKGKCSKCNKDILLYKRYQSGRMNKKPFNKCSTCHREDNDPNKSSNSGISSNEANAIDSFFIGAIESKSDTLKDTVTKSTPTS